MSHTANTGPLFALELVQIDNDQFSIRWSNEAVSSYDLSELQSNCPCAACAEKPASKLSGVKAAAIRSVGRYGLKVEFTSGCRQGIFSYELLWELGMRTHS